MQPAANSRGGAAAGKATPEEAKKPVSPRITKPVSPRFP